MAINFIYLANITATQGAANGKHSTLLPVKESGILTPPGFSLQLSGMLSLNFVVLILLFVKEREINTKTSLGRVRSLTLSPKSTAIKHLV